MNAFPILTDRQETKNINSRLIVISNQLRGDEDLVYRNEKGRSQEILKVESQNLASDWVNKEAREGIVKTHALL